MLGMTAAIAPFIARILQQPHVSSTVSMTYATPRASLTRTRSFCESSGLPSVAPPNQLLRLKSTGLRLLMALLCSGDRDCSVWSLPSLVDQIGAWMCSRGSWYTIMPSPPVLYAPSRRSAWERASGKIPPRSSENVYESLPIIVTFERSGLQTRSPNAPRSS
jgi:hypothetical protein